MQLSRRRFLSGILLSPAIISSAEETSKKYLDSLEEYSVKVLSWNPIDITNYVKEKFDLNAAFKNENRDYLDGTHTGALSLNGNYGYSIFDDKESEASKGFAFFYDKKNGKTYTLDESDKKLSGVDYDELWPLGIGDNGVSVYGLIKGTEDDSHIFNVDAFVIADFLNRKKTIVNEKKKWEEWKILGFDESDQRGVLLSGNGEKMLVYSGPYNADTNEDYNLIKDKVNYNLINTKNFNIEKSGIGFVGALGYDGEIVLNN